MTINTDKLNRQISFNFNFTVGDIARAIIDRVEFDEIEDDSELYDAIYHAMDDELIYTDDLWEIMKYYQTPENANLTDAISYLLDDLLTAVRNSIEQ